MAESLAALNAKLPPQHELTREDLMARGALRLYAATVTRHEVLIRGRDTVHPPTRAGRQR